VGEPGEGQARVRHTAIGVNFIDTYQRSGLYPIPLPGGPGSEGAGVVEAIGPAVTTVQVGDRVAYAGGPPGAYAEVRLVPADRLLKLPEGISDKTAAAMMLKGMTAQYLIRRTYKVQPGDTVLFHAAAGGLGLIACQWLKAIGATVIGTAGSEEKAALGREEHLPGLARQPAPLRPVGELWQRIRPGAAIRAQCPGAQGVPVRDTAHASDVHGQPLRPGGDGP
jgi:NADPH2:quinone reductase